MRRACWIGVAVGTLLVASTAGAGTIKSSSGKFAIGMNVLQPAVFLIGTSFYEDTTCVPIPIEIHGYIKKGWGIAGTLQVRTFQRGNEVNVAELLAAGGPRYRFSGTGKKLQGVYVTAKFGMGYLAGDAGGSDEYRRLTFVVQPEVGYAINVGNPGMFLAFGAGIQCQLPMIQRPDAVDWTPFDEMIVYYTPWLNVTVGYGS